MEKQFTNYQSDIASFELAEALAGIIEPGRIRGFDTISFVSSATGIMNFVMGHSSTGFLKTTKTGEASSIPVGIAMTKQGVIIHNDINPPLVIDQNNFSDPRIDLVILRHNWVQSVGPNPSTIEVIKGTPSPSPIAPTVSQAVDSHKCVALGEILCTGNANNVSSNYSYTPYQPSLIGGINKYKSNSIVVIDKNGRIELILKATGFNKNFGFSPGEIPEIGLGFEKNHVLVVDDVDGTTIIPEPKATGFNKNFGFSPDEILEIGDFLFFGSLLGINDDGKVISKNAYVNLDTSPGIFLPNTTLSGLAVDTWRDVTIPTNTIPAEATSILLDIRAGLIPPTPGGTTGIGLSNQILFRKKGTTGYGYGINGFIISNGSGGSSGPDIIGQVVVPLSLISNDHIFQIKYNSSYINSSLITLRIVGYWI